MVLDDIQGNEPVREAALDSKEILTRSLKAGKWSLADTFIQNLLTYVTFFITARLLTPADFGAISIAGIAPSLIDALTALSFENAVVQKRDGEELRFLNSIWTFNVLRATALFVVTFVAAPLLAQLLNGQQYIELFRLSGLMLLLQSFGNIGQVYFFRDLDFKSVFYRDMATKVTLAVVSVIGAYLFRSYWVLFAASAASSVGSVIGTFVLSSYRPRFEWNPRKLRELLPYSQWIYGQGIIGQLARTLEDSSVARIATPMQVGLFTKAKGLANAPIAPVVSLVNTIGFSAYSRVQDSTAHVREGFYKSFDLLVAIAIPFLAGVYIAGHHILLVLLGSQWISATGYLQVLSTAASVDILTVTLIGPLFNALGRPRNQFNAQIIYLIVLAVAIGLLVPTIGAYGAALAMLAASAISGIYSFVFLDTLIELRVGRLLDSLLSALAATLIPLSAAYYLLRFPFANTTLGFLALAAAGALTYALLLYLLGRVFSVGPYKTLILITRSVLGRQ